ncbi:MAG: glycosyltransferase, partial [Bacteroidales bacterium]|nr:glycosyltransferase [Bacteroidales bacterium]
MNPLASIVVPCFNMERWLPETLQSVLAQTFRDWECLIVDDGSTDG